MQERVTVRIANTNELDWINKCYDEVEFVHSSYDKEIIAVAEINGQKAGIGRLVKVDPHHYELGGIYVFDRYRKQGVARAIVRFLIAKRPLHTTIFCIPFEHLLSFYMEFGFSFCAGSQVPQELLEKYLWCKKKYTTPISLLKLKSNISSLQSPLI